MISSEFAGVVYCGAPTAPTAASTSAFLFCFLFIFSSLQGDARGPCPGVPGSPAPLELLLHVRHCAPVLVLLATAAQGHRGAKAELQHRMRASCVGV